MKLCHESLTTSTTTTQRRHVVSVRSPRECVRLARSRRSARWWSADVRRRGAAHGQQSRCSPARRLRALPASGVTGGQGVELIASRRCVKSRGACIALRRVVSRAVIDSVIALCRRCGRGVKIEGNTSIREGKSRVCSGTACVGFWSIRSKSQGKSGFLQEIYFGCCLEEKRPVGRCTAAVVARASAP